MPEAFALLARVKLDLFPSGREAILLAGASSLPLNERGCLFAVAQGAASLIEGQRRFGQIIHCCMLYAQEKKGQSFLLFGCHQCVPHLLALDRY
jgi:hypothetical protein